MAVLSQKFCSFLLIPPCSHSHHVLLERRVGRYQASSFDPSPSPSPPGMGGWEIASFLFLTPPSQFGKFRVASGVRQIGRKAFLLKVVGEDPKGMPAPHSQIIIASSIYFYLLAGELNCIYLALMILPLCLWTQFMRLFYCLQ